MKNLKTTLRSAAAITAAGCLATLTACSSGGATTSNGASAYNSNTNRSYNNANEPAPVVDYSDRSIQELMSLSSVDTSFDDAK